MQRYIYYYDNMGILMVFLYMYLVHLASRAHLGGYKSADKHARANKLGNHNVLDQTFRMTYYKLRCDNAEALRYYGILRMRPSRPIRTREYIYDDESSSTQ